LYLEFLQKFHHSLLYLEFLQKFHHSLLYLKFLWRFGISKVSPYTVKMHPNALIVFNVQCCFIPVTTVSGGTSGGTPGTTVSGGTSGGTPGTTVSGGTSGKCCS
jgi:hypothetical protein